MTPNFSRVPLHFVRIHVSVGEPSMCTHLFYCSNPQTQICEIDGTLVFRSLFTLLNSSNKGLVLSFAIMGMPGQFFCCQSLFDTNFNNLVEGIELCCFCVPSFLPRLEVPSG